jgi:hypothetical protein
LIPVSTHQGIQNAGWRLLVFRVTGCSGDVFKEPMSAMARRPPSLLIEELDALSAEQGEHRRVHRFACKDFNLFCQLNGKPLYAHSITQRDP